MRGGAAAGRGERCEGVGQKLEVQVARMSVVVGEVGKRSVSGSERRGSSRKGRGGGEVEQRDV